MYIYLYIGTLGGWMKGRRDEPKKGEGATERERERERGTGALGRELGRSVRRDQRLHGFNIHASKQAFKEAFTEASKHSILQVNMHSIKSSMLSS